MKALYARQSLDKKDSVSIETQIDECKRKIHSGDKYEEYIDRGFSGKNTDRKDLQRMLSDIEKGKIDTVIVYRLDRFSRNIADFFEMYRLLSKNNCEFISATEEFDTTTSMGRAMMSILITFAQMERENIQQRVKDNYYYRTAEFGSWAGGPAPFGFENARTKDNRPTLKVIPEEMEIVRTIFNRYHEEADGSLNRIAQYLNNHNMMSRRKNGKWDSSSVSKVLQSPTYVKADKALYKFLELKKIHFLNGEEEWTGKTACHIVGKRKGNANLRKYTDFKEQSVYLTNFAGIIQSYIYIDNMKRLGQNEQIANVNRIGALQELGGVLKCKCGYAIKAYSKSTTGRPYLSCYGNVSLHSCKRKYNQFDFYEIQKMVGKEVQQYIDEAMSVRELYVKERRQKEKQILEIKKQVSKLVDMAATSELAEQAILPKIEKLQYEINKKQLELMMHTDIFDITMIGNLNCGTKPGSYEYSQLSTIQKKYIVNQLIEKIVLDDETGIVEIEWRVSNPSLFSPYQSVQKQNKDNSNSGDILS